MVRLFLRKYASMMINPIFMNSTGCRDGRPGRSIHHFAPLYSVPMMNTIERNTSPIIKI